MTTLGRALWGVGAVSIAAGAWGVFGERKRFQLRNETLPLLPEGSEPIRLLHLSDLHLAPWHRDTVTWVQELAELQPDVIVGTGDFFGHRLALPAIADVLSAFEGVPGVVVHGSNDFVEPRIVNPVKYLWEESGGSLSGPPVDFEGLQELYASLGWHDIDNAAAMLEINGQKLEFIGLGDAHVSRDDLPALTESVEKLREADGASEGLTIGVTHAPYRRVLNSLMANGATVIFAGHTHGGQVRLPGVGALTTNCDLPTRYARGLHTWSSGSRTSSLNVSAGLGTNIYAPVRFFCPPEAVLVTLGGSDFGYA